MRGNLDPVDDHLATVGADGYLIEADGDTAEQYYLSGFWAPDPFVTLYADGEVHGLVSPLEFGRATAVGGFDTVESVAAYDFHERLDHADRHEAWAGMIADFCGSHGVESVSSPPRFPLGVARGLEAEGVDVAVDHDGIVDEVRAVKTEPELEAIAATQAAAEAAMARAEAVIAEAEVADDGTLRYDGEPLTSERVKLAIERQLLDDRCALEDVIVASGADAANPHDSGSGGIAAGETIIVDIFPSHKETRYFGDLTRTFVKGEPTETQRAWYEDTLAAQEAALEALAAGTTGEAVHDAVCEVYEARDHPTLRSDPTTEAGFIHSTGHGVGLAIHESPSLSQTGEELAVNHVVTVEPGLYDPAVGGVRIEDLVVVTEDGHHNLTEYPKRLQVD
ncbi:MAG: M24 family metallopeptidase [Halobacteriales archaeon]